MLQKYIDPMGTRKLSIGMIQLLKECEQREFKHQPPPNALLGTAAGLIRRKFVLVKPYTNKLGKSIMSIYISEYGRKFLNG